MSMITITGTRKPAWSTMTPSGPIITDEELALKFIASLADRLGDLAFPIALVCEIVRQTEIGPNWLSGMLDGHSGWQRLRDYWDIYGQEPNGEHR